MKKILLALNSNQINTGTIDFACFLAKLTKSKLTALFLHNKETEVIFEGDSVKTSYRQAAELAASKTNRVIMDVDQGIHFFLEVCDRRSVHGDVVIRGKTAAGKKSPVEETIKESRFADMLVLDPQTSFADKMEDLPTHFVKEVITSSECPVIIAPLEFNEIEQVVFCYDGSRSSVFAMKQFTYLFSEFRNKKVVVLEVGGEENQVEQKERISSWVEAHYHQAGFETLEGNGSDELFQYFLLKKNLFIVIGAYGRTALSNLFRHSSADLLMRAIDIPLFISHHH